MLKVDFHDNNPNINLIYVVIVARYEGKWVYVRHKERHTYEIPGGHIESGESYLVAAKRELYEETGATDFTIHFVSIYTVSTIDSISGGYLFFSDIKTLSALPDYEMAELTLFDHLPEHLTYPQIQPHLFKHVQEWLNLQGELIDENEPA